MAHLLHRSTRYNSHQLACKFRLLSLLPLKIFLRHPGDHETSLINMEPEKIISIFKNMHGKLEVQSSSLSVIVRQLRFILLSICLNKCAKLVYKFLPILSIQFCKQVKEKRTGSGAPNPQNDAQL